MPLVVALAIREAAVLNRQAVAEGAAEQRGHRGGQGDLGHEQQHAPLLRERGPSQSEVDLGLAAARHAVQEGRLEALPHQRFEHRKYVGLFRRHRQEQRRGQRIGSAGRSARKGVAVHGTPFHVRKSERDQASHHLAADALLAQHASVDAFRSANQHGDRCRLLRAEPHRCRLERRGSRPDPALLT